jgi:hypothetical protein
MNYSTLQSAHDAFSPEEPRDAFDGRGTPHRSHIQLTENTSTLRLRPRTACAPIVIALPQLACAAL